MKKTIRFKMGGSVAKKIAEDIPIGGRQLLIKNYPKASEVRLVPVGDVHYGSGDCDVDLFQGTLDYIKESESYMIGMGDYLNLALKNSKSDIYTEIENPDSSYEQLYEMLYPIRNRIWGLHMGNHEFRVWREAGINITKSLCRDLKVPYLGFATFTKVKVGDNNYTIYSTHGGSGATTQEGKLRAVRRLGESFDADLYLMGHMHETAVLSEDKRSVDYRNKTVKRKKVYYVCTGHFTDYEGSYGEMKNYRPGKKGCAKVKLNGKRWDMHVSI
jgi:predicted phosphodiesterase